MTTSTFAKGCVRLLGDEDEDSGGTTAVVVVLVLLVVGGAVGGGTTMKMKKNKNSSKASSKASSNSAQVVANPMHGVGKNAAGGQWKELYDKASNRTYYMNKETRETSWKKPPGFDGSYTYKPLIQYVGHTPDRLYLVTLAGGSGGGKKAAPPSTPATKASGGGSGGKSKNSSNWVEKADKASGRTYYFDRVGWIASLSRCGNHVKRPARSLRLPEKQAGKSLLVLMQVAARVVAAAAKNRLQQLAQEEVVAAAVPCQLGGRHCRTRCAIIWSLCAADHDANFNTRSICCLLCGVCALPRQVAERTTTTKRQKKRAGNSLVELASERASERNTTIRILSVIR